MWVTYGTESRMIGWRDIEAETVVYFQALILAFAGKDWRKAQKLLVETVNVSAEILAIISRRKFISAFTCARWLGTNSRNWKKKKKSLRKRDDMWFSIHIRNPKKWTCNYMSFIINKYTFRSPSAVILRVYNIMLEVQ